MAGLYGQLLSQELFNSTRAEFKFGYNGQGYAWGHINNHNQKHYASKLYFSQDAQNSTIKVSGEHAEHSYRYAYTPFGQAYGFSQRHSHGWQNHFYAQGYLNAHVVPYLYTGKYTDPLTGMANMDARWYDARTARFMQPDQYNHANLMLPAGAQSELMRYIGRSQSDLLRDPAQQMRYGYVSGNALRWVDPLGLEKLLGFVGEAAEDLAMYSAENQIESGNVLWAVPGLAVSLFAIDDDYFDETDVADAFLGGLQVTGGSAQVAASGGLASIPGAQGMAATLFAHGTGNIAGGMGNIANSIDGGSRDYNFTQNVYQAGATALGLPEELGTAVHAGIDLYTGVSLALAPTRVQVSANLSTNASAMPLIVSGEKIVPQIQTLSAIAAFHETVQAGASISTIYNTFVQTCED